MTDDSVRMDFWGIKFQSVCRAVQFDAWTLPVISTKRQSKVTSLGHCHVGKEDLRAITIRPGRIGAD